MNGLNVYTKAADATTEKGGSIANDPLNQILRNETSF